MKRAKKFLALLAAAALCLALAACGGPIKTEAATDTQKTAVTDAAKACLASEGYQTAVRLYEETTGAAACAPQLLTAIVYHCDDYEGHVVDAIFFRVKADVATTDASGEVTGFTDSILFGVDTATGTVYDSLTYEEQLNNVDGVIDSAEEAILFAMNTPAVCEGKNVQLWSDTETATFFEKADLEEINAALAG